MSTPSTTPLEPLDLSFYYEQCLHTGWFVRVEPQAFRAYLDSGIPQADWMVGLVALQQEHAPNVSPEVAEVKLAAGAAELTARNAATGRDIIGRASFVYVWALFEDLVATAIRRLQRARPDLVSVEEADSFPFWKPRRKLSLLRRLGIEMKREWNATFVRLSGLRNRAAHRRDFQAPAPDEAAMAIRDLADHGRDFILAFCLRFSIRFRFFLPLPGLEALQDPDGFIFPRDSP